MFELRNLAKAVETVTIHGADTEWTKWTLEKAVRDGYASCGWVYKAVSLISRNAATVPFVVKNKNDEIQWDHPVTKLLLNPHKFLNRKQFYELLVQWLQLAGNAYLLPISDSRQLSELFPISPDRILPISSLENQSFLKGYSLKKNGIFDKTDLDYDAEEIIQFSLINPADPLRGISPLEAASKSVDLDVAQQDWNTGTMQNRGVVDSVFTFDKQLDKTQADSILARIAEKFSSTFKRRQPLVLGSGAKFTRLSLTPAEVDFIESRKFNMSEIFIIYGIPPALGGSEASSTYNNFSSSFRIFWETTLIPLCDMMATQFNTAFKGVLEEGYYISADYSDVAALRDSQQEKADISKSYYDMGVPVEQINTKFDLGFEAYDGWDLPFNGLKQANTAGQTDAVRNDKKIWQLIPSEKRNAQAEADRRDKIADGEVADLFTKFFEKQGEDVYAAVENGSDPVDAVKKTRDELYKLISEVAYGVSADFSKTVIVDQRGNKPDFSKRGAEEDTLLDEFYVGSNYILTELSEIQQTTVDKILSQVRESSEKNWTVEQLRQAIEDTGIFSPERALRIARTEVGTAASIGQMVAGKVAGAGRKTWNTGGFAVRSIHSARELESVGIDERFSIQDGSIGPRFPSDFQTTAADRVNCKCFLTFEE